MSIKKCNNNDVKSSKLFSLELNKRLLFNNNDSGNPYNY